jgi:hypothetical protein
MAGPHTAAPFLPRALAPPLLPTWRARVWPWPYPRSLAQLKSCALVNLFMICPDGRLMTRPADDNQILPLIHGYLMSCLTHMRKTLRLRLDNVASAARFLFLWGTFSWQNARHWVRGFGLPSQIYRLPSRHRYQMATLTLICRATV